MPRELDDLAWVELQLRIGELVGQFAQSLGGRTCDHEEDWADCEESDCGFADSRPKPGSMPVVQHFLLLVSTQDMAAPAGVEPVLVSIDGHTQPGYVSRGLALDYLRDS